MMITRIRGRLAELRITQQELADQLGMGPTLINHILQGRRIPPPDFEARVNAALDRLEKAEQAADEARARVLAETAPGD